MMPMGRIIFKKTFKQAKMIKSKNYINMMKNDKKDQMKNHKNMMQQNHIQKFQKQI